MNGYRPSVGEQMGFFVTAGDARNVDGVTSLRERSNVVVVPLPANYGVWVGKDSRSVSPESAQTRSAALVAAGLIRYSSLTLRSSRNSTGLTRSFHAVRLGAALCRLSSRGSCAKTPTAPTPVPVVTPPVITRPASQSLTSGHTHPGGL